MDDIPIVSTDGSFVENWSEKYGEENLAHLSRYKDFDSLVNSHIATKKKLGKNPDTLVEIPTDDSSDEVKAAWAKASGVPDDIKDYEYNLSDELAVKLGSLDEKKMTAAREFAHKELGLSPAKFTKLLDFYHNNIAADLDAADVSFTEQKNAKIAENKAELKKEWRDSYDDKVQMANAIIRKYGGEDAVAEINAENSPLMAKFLNKIADAMSEDTLKGLKSTSVTTATNIKSRINDIRVQMDKIEKENPANFKGNIKYRELKIQKRELYKQMPA